MKLRTYCQNCNCAEAVNSKGILFRRDLLNKYGKTIEFNCSNCNFLNNRPINQIYAVESKLALYFSSIVGITFITWGILIKSNSGWSMIWTTAIGGMFLTAGFYSNMRTTERAFNKTFV